MKLLKLIIAALVMSCSALTVTYAISYARLSVDLSIEKESIIAGETVTINIAVVNSGSSVKVATNPVVTIQLPAGSSDVLSPDCIPSDTSALVCAMAEIGVEETAIFSISAVLNQGGHHPVSAVVEADDLPGGSKSDTELVTVLLQAENSGPVDLAIEISANGGSREIYPDGFGYVTAVVRNTHTENTAYFPVVELQIPQSIEFYSGDFCAEADDIVLCKVPTLAPQSESEFVIALLGKTLDEGATFSAVASSSQLEVQPDNNVAELEYAVVMREVLCGASNPQCFGGNNNVDTDLTSEEQVSKEVMEIASAKNAESSGGGVISVWFLLYVLLFQCGMLLRRRYSGMA